MNLKLFSERFRNNFFLVSMFFIFIVSAQAQKKVSGTVSSNGVPLPSANVVVKGAKGGVSTDIDGKFTLNVSAEAKTLVVSYLGFATKEVQIAAGEMKISLVEEKNTLEEVVVNVGYGTQKKSVVTGAISKVTAKDLEKVPNGGIGQAIQGRASGVTVSANSGAPGSGATIRIRGITTFAGANDPLYIVDGVPIESADIASINQSDIESIEILKDAASAAIYGTRAAKGVVILTTKKGKKGKIVVSYNVYTGVSAPSKTLKLLNATQYGALMNEKSLAGGGNVMFPNLGSLGLGTDWQKQVFSNNAQNYNHELSFSGGNDISTFYVSFGMQSAEGIVAKEISNYDKKTVRINSNHKISKVFTFGENISYTHQKSIGIGAMNNEFGGVLSSAINLDPTTPLIITDPNVANNTSGIYFNNPVIRDANGNPYGISSVVGQEIVNPVAFMKTRAGNFGSSDVFIGNAFMEAEIIPGLKFKTNLSAKKAFWGDQNFTPQYYLNASSNNTINNLSKSTSEGYDWNVENTLNYIKKFKNHNFNALVGQGAYVYGIGNSNYISHSNLPTNNYQDATFNFEIPATSKTGSSYTFVPIKRTSLFARLNYDYNEKYLFTGIIRRDGSSLFGPNHKYGVFPSASVGWVVSKEDFWKSNSVIQSLKIKAGYGVNGNDGTLAPNMYQSLVGGGYNYTIGNNIYTGYAPLTLENPDLHWEETRQSNFGIETKLFHDFIFGFEVYNKKTVGILSQYTLPGYVGVSNSPYGNIADMENKGIELELTYKKKIGQLNFSASGNFSTLKNVVTNTGTQDYIAGGVAFQSMGDMTRTQVGQAYGTFYGYQTAGIFQNQAEINAYKNSAGGLIQPTAKPGDFRWVDNNGDGKIDDKDRTFLGGSLPKITYGLTLNFEYKGFDLTTFIQGAGGNKIFQGLRRLDVGNANYQTDALSRWTGEGTSNTFPRLTNDDTNGNFGKMSDFYLQKGDYLRLKLVSLGYSLPSSLINKINASKVRIYVSGSNLYTLTKYTGYDPEIGGNVMGIDKGYYPQARTFMFGANLQF